MPLSENAQAGYAYQESISGELVADIQARRLEEIGITYWHDMKRAKVQTLIAEIATDPDAYTEVVKAKTAELEAAAAEPLKP